MEKKDIELHVMVDIETLGTNRANAPILSIAAKVFTLGAGNEVSQEELVKNIESDTDLSFRMDISVKDQEVWGRMPDEDTLRWWQAPERAEMWKKTQEAQLMAEDFEIAMIKFHSWLSSFSQYRLMVWSCGIDFDFAIIESAWTTIAKLHGGNIGRTPYWFSHKDDYRTLIRTAQRIGWQKPQIETPHDAMMDVEKQIKEVQSAMAYIQSI